MKFLAVIEFIQKIIPDIKMYSGNKGKSMTQNILHNSLNTPASMPLVTYDFYQIH